MKSPKNDNLLLFVIVAISLSFLLASIASGAENENDSILVSNVVQQLDRRLPPLRGRSIAIHARSDDDDQSISLRNLESESESVSEIPTYEEILNIFKRNANGKRINKNKRKRRKKTDRNGKKARDEYADKKFEDYTGENQDLGFMWHLWYTKGIKYEQRGTDWCVMCQGKDGCEKGSPVVTNHCNPNDPDMRWEYVHLKNGIGQLKTRHHNLCLELREDDKAYLLQRCDEDEEGQMFWGLRYDGKFKLHPYKKRFAKTKQCMSMLHHPLAKKEHDGEEIIDQPCHKPERTQTVYWTADFRPEVEEDIGKRNYKCSAKKRCKECQGDCSNDNECERNLSCFLRNGEGWRIGLEERMHSNNAWAEIPGCSGMGRFGFNYCYDPNKA